MKGRANLIRIAVLSLALGSFAGAQAIKSVLEVAPLEAKDVVPGCGTAYFTSPTITKDRHPVFSTDEDLDFALIKINGTRQRVRLISRKDLSSPKRPGFVGSSFIERWSNESVSIEFRCRVTAVRYEESDFQGVMTIRTGKITRRFKVWGGGGC